MKPKNTPETNFMHIGADLPSIQEARKTVLDIISLPCSDAVKLAAIEAFNHLCTTNVTIEGTVTLGCGGTMHCGDTVKKP